MEDAEDFVVKIMTKRLLALGCSFTRYIATDPESHYWPYILAQNLGDDWKSINLGRSGSSLEDQKDSFFDYLVTFPNPHLVVWGGTCFDRFAWGFPFQDVGIQGSLSYYINQHLPHEDHNINASKFKMPENVQETITEWGIDKNFETLIEKFKNNDEDSLRLLKDMWRWQFKQIKHVKMVCDKLKIPFIYYQLTQMSPIDFLRYKHIAIGDPCVELSNYIAQQHGAYIMDNKISFPNLLECSIGATFFEERPKKTSIKDYFISEEDTHPNIKGHQLIGDLIAKHITKNFNV